MEVGGGRSLRSVRQYLKLNQKVSRSFVIQPPGSEVGGSTGVPARLFASHTNILHTLWHHAACHIKSLNNYSTYEICTVPF